MGRVGSGSETIKPPLKSICNSVVVDLQIAIAGVKVKGVVVVSKMGPILYILIAFPCTFGAIALALRHIYRHLLNYTEPTYQRFIVRIIFMVPVYALTSFLSLVFNETSIYFDSLREIYEAWVIYNFLSLCLEWVGGPGAVVLSLTSRVLKPNWCLMTCCFPPIPLDGRFIRRCKQGCLQFVILKPVLVAVSFLLYAKGRYQDGNFSAKQSYLYITIVYTISYSTALYALVLFYVACRDLLRPFNPVPKFIIIKSVVFLTYWQEYAGANIGASCGFGASLAHALMLNDFYHDTVHQFAPAYHDYVLYNHSNDTGDEGARKYRTKTFVPTGSEMENVRKNKQAFGSPKARSPKAVQETTKQETMKSSLLSDASNSPYELTLIDMDMQVPPATPNK
ncbi:hypothetical protein R6Q57_009507 [Mikania cordata]